MHVNGGSALLSDLVHVPLRCELLHKAVIPCRSTATQQHGVLHSGLLMSGPG